MPCPVSGIERDGRGIEGSAADGRLAGDHARVVGYVGDVHIALRVALDHDLVVVGFQLMGLHAQHRRRHIEQHQLDLFRGHPARRFP